MISPTIIPIIMHIINIKLDSDDISPISLFSKENNNSIVRSFKLLKPKSKSLPFLLIS